jgi:ADP-ribose pyrophosphatase
MKQHQSWKQISRKTVYSTPHLRVHEDTVQLPNGSVVDDYSIVEFNDVIMCVVTDPDNNVIMLQEYRYAVDETMWNLPAGSMKRGTEELVAAARRELREETGYDSADVTMVGELHDYPTKAPHIVHVFRIRNAVLTTQPDHEETEHLRVVLVRPEELKKLVFENQIKTTSVVSAVVLAMPELFGKS